MIFKTIKNFQFHSEHSNYEIQIQSYSEKRSADTYTVILIDLLSENQSSENRIHDDHFETATMWNDLCLNCLTLLMS